MGMEGIGAYICMLQAISMYREFGTQTAKVSINQNITGLLGNIDTNLTCSFVQEKEEQILNVEIFAKNLTEDFVDAQKPIALFQPDTAAKLHTSGDYLKGRVALTNITNTSTNATMKFHILKLIDEKDYMCKLYYYDMDKAISNVKSESTRILVKVPVSDVHINNQPKHKQYDRKTDNITLTCKASGDPEPTYTWFKENNNDTIISRTNLYVIENVIRNNSGVYICEAHNIIDNVNYTKLNSVEIDIVDELLSSSKSASSKISAVHAACAVPLIIAVVSIVICHAVRKNRSNQSKVEKNKESSWQNMVDCLMSCDACTKKPDYTQVVRKNKPTPEVESGHTSNCLKENKVSCRNKAPDQTEVYSKVIDQTDMKYEMPKSRTAPDQTEVYSEVIDQTDMKYEMPKSRTSVTPYNVDYNVVPEDQCHV